MNLTILTSLLIITIFPAILAVFNLVGSVFLSRYLLMGTLCSLVFASLYLPEYKSRGLTPMRKIPKKTIKRLKKLGIILGLFLIDIWLLRYFNTLQWPYLWPRPALYFILSGVLLFIWIRNNKQRRIWFFRLVGFLMLFIGQSYLLHSLQQVWTNFSAIALLHFIGVLGAALAIFLNFVNQFNPTDNRTPPPLPTDLPFVAAVISTFNEPVEIVERTLRSLLELEYPRDRLLILISDDGQRESLHQMAQRYGVEFKNGPRFDAKAGNLNSTLAYLKENYPQASLILTQDADELIHPQFFIKTAGYFSDPKIAFVQTPKEAITPKGDPFGTRDRIFYDRIQPGRNGYGSAFSCGSGVLWRIEALESIGGFDTWNLVEDLTTSLKLHAAGWRSQYHNEILTIGLAPTDIPNLLKQRGTWATDTWRLFLFQNPLLKSGLSIRQRLQYFELCMFYIAAVFFVPMIMFVPLISLATGNYLSIEGSALYTWMLITFLYYMALSGDQPAQFIRMWQYWVGHWPTYTKAFWIALFTGKKKPNYEVTRKTRINGLHLKPLWLQFSYIILGICLSVRTLFFTDIVDLEQTLSNIGLFALFAFMLAGICKAAFYGVEPSPTSKLRKPLERFGV